MKHSNIKIYQSNTEVYQSNINPQICTKVPRNTRTKNKNCYAMLGSVNCVASEQQKDTTTA